MADWTFITNHGLVMAHIARQPDSTAREIAQSVNITERTTMKIIADLEGDGYIERQRMGRNNFYHIDPHIGLRHEATGDVKVGDLLQLLGWDKRKHRKSSRSGG